MKVDCIPLKETGLFSPLFLDYSSGANELKPFYSFAPTIQGFKSAIKNRKYDDSFRVDLVKVINEQYRGISADEKTKANISSLESNKTFTVTTGHQLNIFTGPLYFIYKIVSTINTANRLNREFPDSHFVPVYWMATEDHDFEEINHLFVSGERYEWHSDQKGAVGRFSTDGLSDLAGKLPGNTELFKQAYSESKCLADAVRQYVDQLFKDSGLVVIDGDHPSLKRLFIDVIKDDLVNQTAHKLVETQSMLLADKGFKPQLSSREINLFYLEPGKRNRIVFENGSYEVLESDLIFSEQEILQEVENHPEKFSPNVILRPLYQEIILPNLGYIGGPSELAYWLQLRSMFEHYNTDFPVLLPRNFAMYIPGNLSKKIVKLSLSHSELFKNVNELSTTHIHRASNGSLQLNDQKEQLEKTFDSIVEIAVKVDVTLESHVRAEKKRLVNSLSSIENKLVRAEKRKREAEMNMFISLSEALFPNGVPQERRDNMLGINEPGFIEGLLKLLDPFDLRFHVLA